MMNSTRPILAPYRQTHERCSIGFTKAETK
jgi:hypothetical protein